MDIDASLKALRLDRRAGSAHLGGRALDLLAAAAALPAAGERLPRLVRRVALARPVLAATGSLARRWLEELCRGLVLDPRREGWRESLARCGDGLVARAGEEARTTLRDELERAAAGRRAAFARVVAPGMTLLTISHSSQVEDLLRTLPASCRVLAASSLPGGEGRALAARLEEGGQAAEVVTDSGLARAAAAADLVLLGADALLRPATVDLRRPAAALPAAEGEGFAPADLWGVNKLGSRLLLQTARAAGTPVALAAGLEKCTGDPARPFIRGPRRERLVFESFPLGAVRHFLTGPHPATRRQLDEAAGADHERWRLFMN